MYGQPPVYNNQMMPPPGFMAPPMMGPPMMGPPMVAPPMMAPPPTVIVIGNKQEATITNMAQDGDISNCPYCNQKTQNVLNRKIGCTTFLWCLCLLATTGGLFWLPFCCDGCKDTDVICQRCCNTKTTVQANCC